MWWWERLYNNFVIIDGDFANFKEIEDFFNCCMAAICVSCAGLAAGLTMGLLSLDATKLEIKARVGTEEEKRDAETVLPVVKQHHLLLVTLLLFNSIANETLPIFLGELVPNYLAILLAVFLILIFGEILPSAFFTGAQQLHTSARLIPVVYTLIFILYPIAYPISRVLDKLFGEDEEEGPLRRSEFEALVMMQQSHAAAAVKLNTDRQLANANNNSNTTSNCPVLIRENSILPPLNPDRVSKGWEGSYGSTEESIALLSLEEGKGLKEGLSIEVDRTAENTSSSIDKENSVNHHNHERNEADGLSSSEVTLLLGVLNLSKLTVGCAMIDIQKVYMVSSSNRLDDRSFLQSVMQTGFSRIPVFKQQNPGQILGYMLVKELILSEKDVTIGDIKLREPLFVKPEVGLLEMLGIFQEGQCHLAIATADPTCTVQHLRAGHAPPHYARVLGLVTLEDVLEKVIQGDIVDETDTAGDFSIESPSRGVVATTTTLARKMNRAHTVSDFFADATTISSNTSDTRRRSRGRSNSRVSLTALSSINVVAGDVRHKDRDTSPTRAWTVSTPTSGKAFGSPCTATTLGGGTSLGCSQLTPLSTSHNDFFSDVVDAHVLE